MSILVVLAAATLASGLELNLNTTEEIMPEKGEKIPPFAKTFPGCGCTWAEPRGEWKCEGTIAFPEENQGEKCGCCGMSCAKSNRQTDEVCYAGGYDQKSEMEAERKRLAELLKGADLLLGDDLPGFVVKLKPGLCNWARLEEACKSGNPKYPGLTPLCDHSSYASTKRCYAPTAKQLQGRHFSHYSSHRQMMNLDVDDSIFYGMCFFTTNANSALYPTANSHGWATGGSVAPAPGGRTDRPKAAVPVAKMNDASGELGGWRTICLRNAPNR